MRRDEWSRARKVFLFLIFNDHGSTYVSVSAREEMKMNESRVRVQSEEQAKKKKKGGDATRSVVSIRFVFFVVFHLVFSRKRMCGSLPRRAENRRKLYRRIVVFGETLLRGKNYGKKKVHVAKKIVLFSLLISAPSLYFGRNVSTSY